MIIKLAYGDNIITTIDTEERDKNIILAMEKEKTKKRYGYVKNNPTVVNTEEIGMKFIKDGYAVKKVSYSNNKKDDFNNSIKQALNEAIHQNIIKEPKEQQDGYATKKSSFGSKMKISNSYDIANMNSDMIVEEPEENNYITHDGPEGDIFESIVMLEKFSDFTEPKEEDIEDSTNNNVEENIIEEVSIEETPEVNISDDTEEIKAEVISIEDEEEDEIDASIIVMKEKSTEKQDMVI